MSEDFAKHGEWIIGQIGSLRRMVPPFVYVSAKVTERVDKDLDEFIEKHGIGIERNDDHRAVKFQMPIEYSGRFRYLRQRFQESSTFASRLPRMALVSLISTYDAYLGRLVRTLYSVRPEILVASEKKLSLADLSAFESMQDARSHVIEEEVEDLLRQSHSTQFTWLEKKLGIPLKKNLPTWSDFIEATERRNLFVHTDGVISKQYLAVCEREGCGPMTEVSAGDRVHVEPEYFERACDCVCDIAVKLSQVMWRKLCPDEIEKADTALISASYEFLLTKSYALAENVLRFGTNPPIKTNSKEGELYLLVNLAISLKGQERQEDMLSVLDSIDWSALTDKFQMANVVLRDDFDGAAELMRRLGKDGPFSIAEYRDWPLFRWFRRTTQFKDTYQDVFDQQYVVERQLPTSEGSDDS